MNELFATDVSKLKKIGEGYRSEVFLLESEGKKYIKKVISADKDLTLCLYYLHRAKFVADAFNSFYPDSIVKIPTFYYINEGEQVFAIQEFAEGRKIKLDLLSTFTQPHQMQIATKLGAFLSDLHNLPLEEIEINSKAVNQSKNTKILKKRLKEFIRTFLRKVSRSNIGLIHGDLVPGNILYDPENDQLSIIDFDLTAIKKKKTDFDKLFRFDKNKAYPKGFINCIIDSYNKSNQERGIDFVMQR